MNMLRTNVKNGRALVIVPEFGQRYLTENLIRSVVKSEHHPSLNTLLIIVGDDNYKKNKEFRHGKLYVDHQPNAIELNWPNNVNFAENVNRTIKHCDPGPNDVLFVVNSDIVFKKTTILEMIDTVWAVDGIVGPVVIDPVRGTHVQIYDEKSFADKVAMKAELIERLPDCYDETRKQYNPVITTALSGCCFALKASLWMELGGFDSDNFVAFFEDDDLCIRATIMGCPVVIDFNVAVKHRRGATMRREGGNLDQELMPKSKANFEKKWPEITWDPSGTYEVPTDIKSDDPRVRFKYDIPE